MDEEDDEFKLNEGDYQPYVPLRQRRAEKLTKLGIKLHTRREDNKAESSDSGRDDDDEEEDAQALARKSNISLLDQHTELKRIAEARKESAMERQLKEEEKILESVAEKKALMGVAELAKGIQYEHSIRTR